MPLNAEIGALYARAMPKSRSTRGLPLCYREVTRRPSDRKRAGLEQSGLGADVLESDEKDAEEMAQHEDGSSIPTLGRRHTASRMSRSVRARLVCRSLSSIIPKRATRARRGAQDILFPTKGSRSQTTSRAACLGAEARASSFPLRSARRALVRDMRHTVQRQREPVGSRLGSGAVFDLNSNTRRYEGWTSADAAGLAILPGLVRDDEVYWYLFTADAGVGAGQKRPPRLSYSACSGPGGSRFANWANGLNGLRASWVD